MSEDGNDGDAGSIDSGADASDGDEGAHEWVTSIGCPVEQCV